MERRTMARPKKDAPPDLGVSQELTAGLIERLTCPPGKAQGFLRDTKSPSLRVRVTPSGFKSFVFEAKLNKQTVRKTIGDVREWTIERAREESNSWRVLLDTGRDPRAIERQQQADEALAKAAATAHAVTVGEAWQAYIAERRPHWGDLHYSDHLRKAAPGGESVKRGTRGRGVTIAGPLFSLMALPLRELDSIAVDAWAAREAKIRPSSARLAWRLLKAFLAWCAEQPTYAAILVGSNPAKTKKARESLGRAGVRTDAVQRQQLAVWFEAVCNIPDPVASAYLQCMLITGARPTELQALKRNDVNARWKGLTIRDKVEGERVIPLTPYVSNLLDTLPRRGEWVFSNLDGSGMMSKPHKAHDTACRIAGIDHVTLQGLRRSFKSLTEWMEVPVGVVAQIMGHKPSATAEKHYTVRPLDLLRIHHERIEAWILEQAGVTFDPQATGKLRIVA